MIASALALCLAACSPAADKDAGATAQATQSTATADPIAAGTGMPAPAQEAGEVAPASAASNSEADGADRTVKLPDATSVVVKPLKLSGLKAGIGKVCAVEIDKVTIQTLGSGETEAYDCYKLVEAGALPAKAGAARIGLIYDSGSPNASFRTAVILVREGTAWAVDEASLGEYDDSPAAKSISALAKAAG